MKTYIVDVYRYNVLVHVLIRHISNEVLTSDLKLYLLINIMCKVNWLIMKGFKAHIMLNHFCHIYSKLTLGGPKIIPFQYVRLMSSSLSRPQLILPSPIPFCPCSSSSNSLKFLGTEKHKY